MTRPRAGISFLFMLATAALAAGSCLSADLPGTAARNPDTPKQIGEPVFYADQHVLTPAMEAYFNAAREKIRHSGARDWPEDVDGKKAVGEVVVQITLRKSGYIKDLRTSVVSAQPAANEDDNNALSESVAQHIKNAQPYPPFASRTFEGYELVSFGVTVGSTPVAARPAATPGVDAQGRKERLELRTRVPF